ncbi:hypothetical protein SAMN05192553_10584 [Cyclobacterium xiamenense]|uniref:Uncharacterized protein n=1 Tax=Cyclobacterium xiamenense TaxID=1297121 RepID=A0A1H6ZRY7_9BACT|nr:hypothetical protein [Cyclobacterium xiamenense]SEJ55998.1 hypothetical protein SAMN05192553_10584 [Cyclobacterium xiamenense]
MSALRTIRDPFFFYFSCLMLIIAVGGFGLNAIVNPQSIPPNSTYLVAHGTCMTLWYLLVVVQAGLIRVKNIALHKRLGKSSVVLAIGILVSGILVTINRYTRSEDAAIVMASIVMMGSFIMLYAFALYHYQRPVIHKRLILYASLAMLVPSLGRLTRAMGINEFLSLLFLILLALAPLVYDKKTLKKVQGITFIGIVTIIVGLGIIVGVGLSESWANFLASIMLP